MDRLIEAINTTQNPSVVGLDPTEALVPAQVVASFADEGREEFLACDAEKFGIIFPEFHSGCVFNFGANIRFFSMSWSIFA